MHSYTKEEILTIYGHLMECAHRNANNKMWENALADLESAAEWAYSFNWIYTDENAESLIRTISVELIPQLEVQTPISNRCVLIDSFCMDNRGLTQQYMRAMIQNGMEILFICTSKDLSKGEDILNELNDYSKASTLLFEETGLSRIDVAKCIAEKIVQYSPQHVFLHISPWDTVALMACNSFKGSCIYNINLTDHAYWMGQTIIDYNIEFRPYGKTVSLEKRGFLPGQLLTLPFYPVQPLKRRFRGLPEVPQNAIKVFTGGTLYKMLGKDDIFFKIMDLILSISPNVYIFVAGFDSNRLFDEKCSKLANKERILQIGIRDDIDAVYDNCDVYLSTYPTSGGLMSQYAAKHGKPLIAYHDVNDVENAAEEMINHFQDSYRSFSDLSAMVDYARRLVDDTSFRQKEGEFLQKGLMTEESFSESFLKMLETRSAQWNWTKDNIDYDAFFERYLDLENQNGFSATMSLVHKLKLKSFAIYSENIGCLLGVLFFSVKRKMRRLYR